MIKHESGHGDIVPLYCHSGRSVTPGVNPDTPKVILITPNEKNFINVLNLFVLWHWN